MGNAILLKNLSKRFSNPQNPDESCLAVDGITLEVGEQEFLTMVGPSGCGKSTVLRMIAGLEQVTSGEIYVKGQRVDSLPPQARNVGFMFQGYALFKHMTVAENIGFGLQVKRVPKRERQQRIAELVSLVGLGGLEGRKPNQLSGGQQQRVALARALAPRPRLLLLDEPFGALDAKVRQKLRADTKRWQQELKIPTILVTHDQREALELGDRVVIMNAGRFEQIDTSWNIYNNPENQFVARFIGRVNVFSTRVGANSNGLSQGAEFEILVRPEDMSIRPWDNHQPLEEGKILGTVVSHAFLGRTVRLEVQLRNGQMVTVALPKHQAFFHDLTPGRSVILSIDSFRVFPSAWVSLNHSQAGLPIPARRLGSDPSQEKEPVTWSTP